MANVFSASIRIIRNFNISHRAECLPLVPPGKEAGDTVLSLPVTVPRDGPLMRLTVARQAQGLSLIKHTSLSKQGLKKALGLNNGQHDLCDRDCALSFRNSSAQGRPPI